MEIKVGAIIVSPGIEPFERPACGRSTAMENLRTW
jgi:hypothetical protein